MPDKVTEAAIRLLLELVGALVLGAIAIGLVLTFVTYAIGPDGWCAQLAQWIGG